MNSLQNMQEQNESLIEMLKSIKDFSGMPNDIKATLRNLQEIEKEWKSIIERLNEREKEYNKLIEEIKQIKEIMEL